MATLTQHTRYMPVIKWSDTLITYNIFRVWEWLFGRRFGVRPEALTSVTHENGKRIITRKFFTTEAFVCHCEAVVREFLKGARFEFEWVTLPQFQYANFGSASPIKLPSIVFAIAFDAIGAGGSASNANSITYSHTNTGTDIGMTEDIMIGDVNGGAGTVSGITYAGAGGWAQTQSWGPTGGRKMDLWDKAAPATGANNVVVSFGNLLYADVNSLSYSGCDQTNIEDISTQSNGASPRTPTLTTLTDNCWLSGCASDLGTGPATASTGTTSRGTAGALRLGDSNGAKSPAGSYSMSWTGAGTITALLIAIKPSSGTAIVPSLASLGVGA